MESKKSEKLANGVIFIRAIFGGSRTYEYRTKFAFDRMVRRYFGRPMMAEYWACPKCGNHWKSARWAAKHSC